MARTKQILSANTEAPISVEELWQDRDFRSTISRDKFEELAGEGSGCPCCDATGQGPLLTGAAWRGSKCSAGLLAAAVLA